MKNRKAFTMIELIIVISIIGILAAVLIPKFGFVTDKAKEAGMKQDFRLFQTAAESSIMEYNFKNLTDYNYENKLNEFLDATYQLNFGESLRNNPWGYNYIIKMKKDATDGNSGTIEVMSTQRVSEMSDETSTASIQVGKKLYLSVRNQAIESKIVAMEPGDGINDYTPGVTEMTGIKITKMPDKVTYAVGEDFDSSGMVVKIANSEGEMLETSDYTISASAIVLGSNLITISYNVNNDIKTTMRVTGTNVTTQKILSSLEVTTQPTKTAYKVGESFSKTGMVITANFTDSSTANITTSCTHDGNNLAFGKTAVTVFYTYNGVTKSTTVPITVEKVNIAEKTLASITIKSQPSKTSYHAGENFNPAGMEVEATFSDATKLEVSSSCVHDGFNLLSTKTQVSVSFTHNGVTKSQIVPITVTNAVGRSLSSVTVQTLPTKTIYAKNENFNPLGMVLKANYTDGTNGLVTNYTVSNGNNLTAPSSIINISYTEDGITKTTTVTVTVNQTAVAALYGINIENLPASREYFVGDSVNTAGMIVKVLYMDGTSKYVDNYTLANHTNLQIGNKTITVSYSEGAATKTAQFIVTVTARNAAALNSVIVSTAPSKLTYIEGENFNPAGMIVKAVFSDSSMEVVNGYILNNHLNLVNGASSVTINYTHNSVTKSVTQPISVVPFTALNLYSVDIAKAPYNIMYATGEVFEPAGLVLKAVFDNKVTRELSESDYTIVNGQIQAGQTTVKIAYTHKGVTRYAFVGIQQPATLTSIKIVHSAYKTQYVAGEFFDPAGMKLEASFNNGVKITVDASSYDETALRDGQSSLNVQYSLRGVTKTITHPIQVRKAPIRIEIVTPPTRTTYREGSYFDKTGMVVRAVYEDSTTDNVDVNVLGTGIINMGMSYVILEYTWADYTQTCAQPVVAMAMQSSPIQLGTNTTYLLNKDDGLYAAGNNSDGQLTTLTAPRAYTKLNYQGYSFTNRSLFTKYKQVFILDTDQNVYSLGENTYGQLGIGTVADSNTPNKIVFSGLSNPRVRKVASGKEHTIFLLEDGSIWAAGRNNLGQLALGNTIDQKAATKITDIQLQNKVKDVVCGDNTTFFLLNNGTVMAVGANDQGQLGLGDLINRTGPALVTALTNVAEVRTYYRQTYFQTESGEVYGCGWNNRGQLGLGDTNSKLVPTLIPETGIRDVQCGNEYALFLMNNGTVKGIGENTSGQLGIGDLIYKDTLVPIPGLKDIETICVAETHAAAVDKNGKLYTWGNNSYGEQGLGHSRAKELTPRKLFEATGDEEVLSVNPWGMYIQDPDDDNRIYYMGYAASGGNGLEAPSSTSNLQYPSLPYHVRSLDGLKDRIKFMVTDGSNESQAVVTTDGELWISTGAASHAYITSFVDNSSTFVKVKDNFQGGITKLSYVQNRLMFLTDVGRLYSVGTEQGASNFQNKNTPTTQQPLAYATDTKFSGLVDSWYPVPYDLATSFVETKDGKLYVGGDNRFKNENTASFPLPRSCYVWSQYETLHYGNDTRGLTINPSIKTGGDLFANNVAGPTLASYTGNPIGVGGHGCQLGYNYYQTYSYPVGHYSCSQPFTSYTFTPAYVPDGANINIAGKLLDATNGIAGKITTDSATDSIKDMQYSYAGTDKRLTTVQLLTAEGNVWSWGFNNKGSLGNNTTEGWVHTPVKTLTNIEQIYAGTGSFYALAKDGKVFACGDNTAGELGLGNTTGQKWTQLTFPSGDYAVTDVYPGEDCAVFKDINGKFWGAGSNAGYRLGAPSASNYTTLTEMPWFVGAEKIILNSDRLVLQKADGIYVCGVNSNFRLGVLSQADTTKFTKLPSLGIR